MGTLKNAEAVWNSMTIESTRVFEKYGQMQTEEFRKLGDAEALLTWEDCCTIKKIESITTRTGAASSLLTELKKIADHYNFRIFANICPYPTTITGIISSQDELEEWYRRQSFEVYRDNNGYVFGWYPQRPTKHSNS